MEKMKDDVIELLEYLEELIEKSPKVPITGRNVIDKKEFLAVVDQIVNTLPDQIKKAKWVITEKDRLLKDAQSEYEIAREESLKVMKHNIENHDIVKEAKMRANEIIALAQRDAKAIRLGSREYSTEILGQLDKEIEEKKTILIKNMQNAFESVAKEIDRNLSQIGTEIKENILELRGM